MGQKSKAGAYNGWDRTTIDSQRVNDLHEILSAAQQPLHSQALAHELAKRYAHVEPSASAARVKKYDHRCDYEEGERVFVDNRYGRSFATITKIIRQPVNAFCDKAFLVFDDSDYRTRWEQERSTPYFAINSGRTNAAAVFVDAADPALGAVPQPRSNATAVAKLGKQIDKHLAEDSRFASGAEGWTISHGAQKTKDSRPAAKPHISAEPGGTQGPLPQGMYKAPLLEVLDKLGEANIEDIKRNVQSTLKLGPADWETDKTGKIVWIHRLHAAIKHLKRVGTIESPSREVYRRSTAKKQKTA